MSTPPSPPPVGGRGGGGKKGGGGGGGLVPTHPSSDPPRRLPLLYRVEEGRKVAWGVLDGEYFATVEIPALDGAVSDHTRPRHTKKAHQPFYKSKFLKQAISWGKFRHLLKDENFPVQINPGRAPPPRPVQGVVAYVGVFLAKFGFPNGKVGWSGHV